MLRPYIQRRQHQAFWAVGQPPRSESPYLDLGVSAYDVRVGLLSLVFNNTLLLESVTMDQLPTGTWRIQAVRSCQAGATWHDATGMIWNYLGEFCFSKDVQIMLEVRPLASEDHP